MDEIEDKNEMEFTPIDWTDRKAICLHCGKVFYYNSKLLFIHIYQVHKHKSARTGIDYLMFNKYDGRIIFFVRAQGKRKRIVSIDDELYGDKVRLALEYLKEGSVDAMC
jgi:hypothetical protein